MPPWLVNYCFYFYCCTCSSISTNLGQLLSVTETLTRTPSSTSLWKHILSSWMDGWTLCRCTCPSWPFSSQSELKIRSLVDVSTCLIVYFYLIDSFHSFRSESVQFNSTLFLQNNITITIVSMDFILQPQCEEARTGDMWSLFLIPVRTQAGWRK